MGALHDPAWVHVVTNQRVVELGLRSMLAAAATPYQVTSGHIDGEPDVVLFDVVLMRDGDTTDLDIWVKDTATTVIAVDRTLRPELGVQARSRGVEWGITLGINEMDLAKVVGEAATGTLEDSTIAQEWATDDYLGKEGVGLSPRESGVLALVVRGRTNQEVASELYVSINTVKTYIRSAYRKIGATSRSQAVAWAMQAGFQTNENQF